MKRRSAIGRLFIVAGGIALFPSCIRDTGKASTLLQNLDINEDQEKLLAEIAETIIPQTDSPGAKEMGVHFFVLKMVDDCYEKEDQQKFLKGLEQVEHTAKEHYGNSYVMCTVTDRIKILEDIENKADESADGFSFYRIMKQRTIQGYLNSEYVMNNLLIYEMIPGRYNGYFPATRLNQTENG